MHLLGWSTLTWNRQQFLPVSEVPSTWRRDGCELGFGAGIAQGYATLGQIGLSEHSG